MANNFLFNSPDSNRRLYLRQLNDKKAHLIDAKKSYQKALELIEFYQQNLTVNQEKLTTYLQRLANLASGITSLEANIKSIETKSNFKNC